MAQFLPVFLDTGSIRVATGSRIIDFMHFPVTRSSVSSSYSTLLPDPYLFATTSADITNAVNTTSSSLFQLQTSRRQANYFYVHNSIIGVSTSATTTGVRIGLQTLNSADTSANIKVASTLTAHTIACIGTFSPTTFALPASMAAINTIYPSFVKGLYNNSTASANMSNVVLLQPETNNTVTARSGSMSYNKFIGYRADLLDRTFNIGTGFDTAPFAVEVLKDQKILAGGGFISYNGTTANKLIKLDSDGTVNSTFNIGTGFNDTIYSLAVQSDEKILAGGNYTLFNGVSTNRIVRLNSDGTRDTSFNIGAGFNSIGGAGIRRIIVTQSDKILIVGDFSSYSGSTSNNIIRLNADGTRDTSFTIGTGFNDVAYAAEIQSDEKILIGGGFTSYNSVTQNRITRLNSDGTRDTTFNIGTGFNSSVNAINIQSDGKIIVGGGFTTYSGSTQNRITRLNSNGTIDTSFNTGTGFNAEIFTMYTQPDGKIIVGGNFTTYSGSTQNWITRLNSDGTRDTTFDIGTGANNFVLGLSTQTDNRIIVVGNFTSFNENSRQYIVRLLPEFIVDQESTPLFLFSGSLKPITGSHTITSSFLPVTSSQWFSQSLATNVANTSNVGYATVFTLTGLTTGQRYLANLYLIGSSAAAATGFRMRVTTGSAYRGTLYTPTSTTAAAIQNSADGNNITSITAGTWPTVNVKYLVYGEYTFVKAAQDPQVQILSETNGTAVTAFSESVIYYRAID